MRTFFHLKNKWKINKNSSLYMAKIMILKIVIHHSFNKGNLSAINTFFIK